MPKMTALLIKRGSTPGLGGAHYVLEGSYSGGRRHIINWRGYILQSGSKPFSSWIKMSEKATGHASHLTMMTGMEEFLA